MRLDNERSIYEGNVYTLIREGLITEEEFRKWLKKVLNTAFTNGYYSDGYEE